MSTQLVAPEGSLHDGACGGTETAGLSIPLSLTHFHSLPFPPLGSLSHGSFTQISYASALLPERGSQV